MPLTTEMFPSKYVSTPDLKGRPVTMKISHVVLEDMGDGEKKWVLYFIRAEKGLVLNIINTQSIAQLHGENTDLWVDKVVQLYPTTTEMKGKIVPCIRIQAPPPAVAAAVPAPTPPPNTAPVGGDLDGGGDLDDQIPF